MNLPKRNEELNWVTNKFWLLIIYEFLSRKPIAVNIVIRLLLKVGKY